MYDYIYFSFNNALKLCAENVQLGVTVRFLVFLILDTINTRTDK